jgi:uncharacterized protein HemY
VLRRRSPPRAALETARRTGEPGREQVEEERGPEQPLSLGGDLAAARKSTAEALALEPDSNEILVQSLDVLLAAKDWPAVVKTIETLEKSGGYDFKGHIDGEPWAEFRQQPAAKPWL